MDPETEPPSWRPFSVLVLSRGQKELVRVPTPGHFEQVRQLVENGTYGLYRSSTQGVFTLERQLESIMSHTVDQV